MLADLATGKSRQVSARPLLATLVTSIDWTADGNQLITVLLPEIVAVFAPLSVARYRRVMAH